MLPISQTNTSQSIFLRIPKIILTGKNHRLSPSGRIKLISVAKGEIKDLQILTKRWVTLKLGELNCHLLFQTKLLLLLPSELCRQ